MKKEHILIYLSKHKYEFNKKFDIIKIGLFGSYARDEATNQSDIDLLIEMKEGVVNVHDKKEAFKALLEKNFHKKIDLYGEC